MALCYVTHGHKTGVDAFEDVSHRIALVARSTGGDVLYTGVTGTNVTLRRLPEQKSITKSTEQNCNDISTERIRLFGRKIYFLGLKTSHITKYALVV